MTGGPLAFRPMFPLNIPNLLTVVRILLVPVLVVALLETTGPGDLPAAIVFAYDHGVVTPGASNSA